jgi:hypothetical protein
LIQLKGAGMAEHTQVELSGTDSSPSSRPDEGGAYRASPEVASGFPGRVATGTCLAVAPLLAIAGTVIGMGAYHAKGADFVAGMAAHPHDVAGVQVAQAAMMMLLLGVIGLAGMIAAHRPAWGRTAGTLTVLGLCGPIAFEHLYWGASHLTDTAVHRAAAATMIDQSQIMPRSIMNITGPCLVVGFLLLGIAAAKSGIVHVRSASASPHSSRSGSSPGTW